MTNGMSEFSPEILIKSIKARIPKCVDNSQDPLLEHLLKLSPHDNTIILETSNVNIVQYSHYINELITVLSDQTLIEETRISVESELLAFVSHIPKINTKDSNPYPHFYLSRVLMDNFDIIYEFISIYYNLNLTSTLTKFLVKVIYSLQFWELFHLMDSVKNLKSFLNLLDFEITDTSLGYLVKPPKNYLEENLYQGFQYPFPYPFYNYSYHKLGDNIPEKYSKISIEPYIDISLKNLEPPRKRRKTRRERRPRYIDDFAQNDGDEVVEEEIPRKKSSTPQKQPIAPTPEISGSDSTEVKAQAQQNQSQSIPNLMSNEIPPGSLMNNQIYPYATYYMPYMGQPDVGRSYSESSSNNDLQNIPKPPQSSQSNDEIQGSQQLQINQFQVIQQQIQFIQRHQQRQQQQQQQQSQIQGQSPIDNNNPLNFPPIQNPYGYPMQFPYPMYQQPYQVDARGQLIMNPMNPMFYDPNLQYQAQLQQAAQNSNGPQNQNPEPGKSNDTEEKQIVKEEEPNIADQQESKPQDRKYDAGSDVEESNSVNNDDSDYEDTEKVSANIKRRERSKRIRKPKVRVDKSEDSEKSEKEDTYAENSMLKDQITDEEEALSGEEEKSKGKKSREIHQCDGFDASTNAPCRKIFYGRNELLRHKEYVHATRKRIYKCIYCARYNSKVQSYPRPDSLARHLRRNHQINGKENKLAVGYAKQHLVIIEDPSKLTHTQLLEIATSPLPHPPFLEPDFSLKANRTGFLSFNTKEKDDKKDLPKIEDKKGEVQSTDPQNSDTVNKNRSISTTPSQPSSQQQSPHNQTVPLQPPQLPKISNPMSSSYPYYDPNQIQNPPVVLPFQGYNPTYQQSVYQPMNSFVGSYQSNQNQNTQTQPNQNSKSTNDE
ncbi:hypothetical protein CLIB1444_13S02674 [[Candida] jaroonii]|uniref:Uncharacterized protein n=1 Tax=[Candida] jaroonii TaxID=467808 RepID=A0ACA9YEB5_9ASCO|nr:hypothetical protein CLIB1444_13S02674 [[Candida] jaroonii]